MIKIPKNITDEQHKQLKELEDKIREVEDMIVDIILPKDFAVIPTIREVETKLAIVASMIADNTLAKIAQRINSRDIETEQEETIPINMSLD